jgi:FKBP-type peptidyl-prolyl cis-trans isomerase
MRNNTQMLRKITLHAIALLGILVVFNACKKEYESLESIDDAKMQAYINSNNIKPTKGATGYYYQVLNEGTGDVLKNSDSIFYSYNFKTLSGTILNQSTDLRIPGTFLGYTDRFVVNNTSYLLTPVREVLSKLKRGGKATLILPSYLAFGKNGIESLGISSNEIIVMDLGIYTQAKLHEINDFEIGKFIAANKLTLMKDPSRAYYNVITPGTGKDAINLNSKITANYTVRTLEGSVLETATGGTFSEVLNDLYKGWQLILPGRLTAGGKIRLVIPADLGGGTQCLDFDIEIVSVAN